MAKSTRRFTGVGMLPDLPPITLPADGHLTGAQVNSITDALRGLLRAVNGKLNFGGDGTHSSQAGNIDGQVKSVYFASANTDYEVPHGLGRLPIGIVTLDVDADGAVLRGGSRGSWSATRMAVRCNVAGTTGTFVVV